MTKVKVDMALLNGHDYIAIEEATGKPIAEVLGTARGIYAAAWRARVRDGDLSATFDDTLNMSLADFDIVNAADNTGNGDSPKPQGPESGGPPLSSPGPGG